MPNQSLRSKPITDTDLRFAPHFTLAWLAHRDQDLANGARCAGRVETARSFERSSLAAEIELVALQPLCSRDYHDPDTDSAKGARHDVLSRKE